MNTKGTEDQSIDRQQLARALPAIVVASNMGEHIHRPNEADVQRSLDLIWPQGVAMRDLDWQRDGELMRLPIESGGFARQLRVDEAAVLLLAKSDQSYPGRHGSSGSREMRFFALVTPRVAVSSFVSVGDYCDENFDGELSAEIVVGNDLAQMQAHVRRELSRLPHDLFDAEERLRNIYGQDALPAASAKAPKP
jgi:hypothetical protein